MSFVNELLAGEVAVRLVDIPYTRNGMSARGWRYGKSQITNGSWLNLKRRLTTAGFIVYKRKVEDNPEIYYIVMEHPALRGL